MESKILPWFEASDKLNEALQCKTRTERPYTQGMFYRTGYRECQNYTTCVCLIDSKAQPKRCLDVNVPKSSFITVVSTVLLFLGVEKKT